MSKRSKTHAGAIAVVAILVILAVLPWTAGAGNLNPPGAPASSMKTLSEVEPRTAISAATTISVPGSYYLTGNLLVSSGVGITVAADNVTIDLMGYALLGSGSATDGIHLGSQNNVEIRNGTVATFTDDGVETDIGGPGNNHRVINVRVLSNGGKGIYLYGEGNTVKDCIVHGNSSTGINVHTVSIIKNNVVHGNGGTGIRVDGNGCKVIGNTTYDNADTGVLVAAGATVLRDNTAYDNGFYGFYIALYPCTITGNTAYKNDRSGFNMPDSAYSLVDQNAAYDNNVGGGGFADLNGCTADCTLGNNYFATSAPKP